MFKLLIPSYKRCGKVKAIHLAEQFGISPANVYISVQCKEDYDNYGREYGRYNILFEENSSAAGNRNTLLKILKPGEKAIMSDDDVFKVCISTSLSKKEARLATIKDLETVFERMDSNKTVLGGTYPSDNQMFIQNAKEWSCNAMLTGCFLFCIGGVTPLFNTSMEALEDYEICARIVSSGGYLTRWNRMFTERTNNRIKDALDGKGETGGYRDAYMNGAHERAMKLLLTQYAPILKRAGSGGRALMFKNV